MVDFRRDFWIREKGTCQKVTQLHERYLVMMTMMMMMMMDFIKRYLIYMTATFQIL